ncbi:MAG: MaoC/PaaZ C-terminal domain-containing protein [Rhodospirillales bacterium]|jgi:acyl dehydratase|nr:3-alpha,7-alpha,12-alpha-trihydroxy-5-beta-cholest-24-enoyl-CoA hydratase [Rhodospirillaceae bacterium]MDP6426622.1 MaoC/PaaZ C-terminal domain-containing protein [Rhodospirillales bacterium]MDP6644668.1 MaoC/PaaZ C-terminal domain-containing protein [Rhodospirillales bacterium]MDP6842243.1 MaoC/PaaZ C-terminal domain-containing protein [Rhodospirillales bacterium]|tara:strand:+ start:1029 stop:1895 length:867 start_codon:yes stop_codon:yes gene_type:complete
MTLDYDAIMNYAFPDFRRDYSKKDTMLYALGLGLGSDPMDEDQLKFVYEKNLQAMPTMPVILGFDEVPLSGVPELRSIDFTMLVHGEEYLTIHNPLPVEGTTLCRTRILDILDKGADKGAIVYREKEILNAADDTILATTLDSIFLRGNGGFGGEPGPAPAPPVHKPPDTEPEVTWDRPTLPQAALIYRLSGDYNPLHAEPAFAAAAKWERPILHGLCSFGIAGQAVIKHFCDYDPGGLKALQVRFSAPFFPGETLRTEMWRDGDVVSFRARAVERDVVVINNGRADI